MKVPAWFVGRAQILLVPSILCLLVLVVNAQPQSNYLDATKNNQNMVRTERGWVIAYLDNEQIKLGFKPFAVTDSDEPWQIYEVPPDPNPSPSLQICIGAKEIYDGLTNLRTMVFLPWVLSEEWNDKIHVRMFRITGTAGEPPYTVEMLEPDWDLLLPDGFAEGPDTWLTQPTISMGSVPTVFVGVNSISNPSNGGVCCWYSQQTGAQGCIPPYNFPCVFEGETAWQSHWLDDAPEVQAASQGTIGNVFASNGYVGYPCVAWTRRGWDNRMSELWYTDCWDYNTAEFRWFGYIHEHEDPNTAPLAPIHWSVILGNRQENDFDNLSLTEIQNTESWLSFQATAGNSPRSELCVLRADHSLHAHMPYLMQMDTESEWHFVSWAPCAGDAWGPSIIQLNSEAYLGYHLTFDGDNYADIMLQRRNVGGEWNNPQFIGHGRFVTLDPGSAPPGFTGISMVFTEDLLGTPHDIVLGGSGATMVYVPDPYLPISSFEEWTPPLHLSSSITIESGGTLVFKRKQATCEVNPEPEIVIDSDAQIIVKDGGTLSVEGENGDPIIFKAAGANNWKGFFVEGNASFDYCTVQGATTAIQTNKAETISINGCAFESNDVGIYSYQPIGTAKPVITDCDIQNNTKEGLSLFACAGVTISECRIRENGGHGVMLTNSAATMDHNLIEGNGASTAYYGLYLFGSSPILYCNEFINNTGGELTLLNYSYPVLWSPPGTAGGVNKFLNDTRTLVTIMKSDPVVKGGHNNFLLGSTGYFMHDGSPMPLQHNLTANYWNPALSLSLLWPSNFSVWSWSSVDPTQNQCGAGMAVGEGAEALFAAGIATETSGSLSEAQTSYEQIITDYPADPLALASAARLFDVQRELGTGVSERQTYFAAVATEAAGSALADAATALVTRLYPEDGQFQPPLTAYEGLAANAPTETDSVFAVVDFDLTEIRAAYEGAGGGLDSEGPTYSSTSIHDAMSVTALVLPHISSGVHEGYVLAPNSPKLIANYPNPFNPTTTLSFYLPADANVQLEVYNIQGQIVETLVNREFDAGMQRVTWNASGMSSGVYFCRMMTGADVSTLKLLMMK